MKKSFKRRNLSAAPQDEAGVPSLITKVQQQLSAMEKKLDILISQCSQRPFEKTYPQNPPRHFDRSHRHDRGRHGDGPRERTYTRVICADCNKVCEIPFKPSPGRPVYCKECFSKRKTGVSFNANLDNRPEKRDFPREHRSDKTRPEQRQKPVKNKKPFFARRKKHS